MEDGGSATAEYQALLDKLSSPTVTTASVDAATLLAVPGTLSRMEQIELNTQQIVMALPIDLATARNLATRARARAGTRRTYPP